MARTTEIERIRVERVGQDIFRTRLMSLWGGRCAITGLGLPELLRAGHAKPWSRCESNGERLDECDGLLLAAHLDAALDRGLIAIGPDGGVLVSSLVPAEDRVRLGLERALRVAGLSGRHHTYLAWHRANIFRPA